MSRAQVSVGGMKSASEWAKIFIKDFAGVDLLQNVAALKQFISWVQSDVPVFAPHHKRRKNMDAVKGNRDIDFVEWAVHRMAKLEPESLVGELCVEKFENLKRSIEEKKPIAAMQWIGGDYDCLNKFCGMNWGRADAHNIPNFELAKENVVVWDQIQEQWLNCPINHFIVREPSGCLSVYSPEAFCHRSDASTHRTDGS